MEFVVMMYHMVKVTYVIDGCMQNIFMGFLGLVVFVFCFFCSLLQ